MNPIDDMAELFRSIAKRDDPLLTEKELDAKVDEFKAWCKGDVKLLIDDLQKIVGDATKFKP